MPALYTADFGDGHPAIQFNSTPDVNRMWCRTPFVTSGVFSMAVRLRVPNQNGKTILSVYPPFPGGTDLAFVSLYSSYTAGVNATLRFDVNDDAGTNGEAAELLTHSAWHTAIMRCDGSTLSIRIDGVNGTPVTPSGPSLTTLSTLDQSGLACEIFTDGSYNGSNSNGAIRHILVADGTTWSDGQCSTIETEFTSLWT